MRLRDMCPLAKIEHRREIPDLEAVTTGFNRSVQCYVTVDDQCSMINCRKCDVERVTMIDMYNTLIEVSDE